MLGQLQFGGRTRSQPSSTPVCSGPTTSSRRSAPSLHSGAKRWSELAEDQEAWLATAPQHVREVYKQGSPSYVFQLLAFSQSGTPWCTTCSGASHCWATSRRAADGCCVLTPNTATPGPKSSSRPSTQSTFARSSPTPGRTNMRRQCSRKS